MHIKRSNRIFHKCQKMLPRSIRYLMATCWLVGSELNSINARANEILCDKPSEVRAISNLDFLFKNYPKLPEGYQPISWQHRLNVETIGATLIEQTYLKSSFSRLSEKTDVTFTDDEIDNKIIMIFVNLGDVVGINRVSSLLSDRLCHYDRSQTAKECSEISNYVIQAGTREFDEKLDSSFHILNIFKNDKFLDKKIVVFVRNRREMTQSLALREALIIFGVPPIPEFQGTLNKDPSAIEPTNVDVSMLNILMKAGEPNEIVDPAGWRKGVSHLDEICKF